MPPRLKDEETAIMAQMEAESRAFWEQDWDAWTACWVHAPYVRRSGWWSLGGITQVVGWETIRERMKARFDENPTPNRTAQEFELENVSIRVSAEMAWVTYDMRASDTGEPEMDMPGLTHETKILEKHDGEWLLAYVGYLHHSVRQVDHPLIQVDGTAHLLWHNDLAKKELTEDRALRAISGRLCAATRTDTKRLKDMITWAASLSTLIDTQSGAVPLILKVPETGEYQLCWVMANSGKIYVAINNQELTEQRLAAAAVIHGLTPAQVRLARQIVAGRDLPTAAQTLGVTPATVRTQLQRIYDKVGIRTQPALVRILMSAAAPTIQI